MMDENELRELWRQATPGPMAIGYHECASIAEMAESLRASLQIREGEPQALTLWFIYQDHPDPPYPHGVNTCVTGNGPNARNNAVFYAHCHDAVPLLLDEVERLRAEREATQNDERILTCAFCGYAYPPGTPPSNHRALEAHIRECPGHPLPVALRELANLRRAIEDLAPAGSEFVGDTAACLDWIRKELSSRMRMGAERNRYRDKAERLRGVLRQVEWSNYIQDDITLCPLCDQDKSLGHSPDCPLGAALEG